MAVQHALIVDDSRTAAVALSRLLSRQGVAAVMMSSGEAAFDYLQGNRPDVIFMDHMMPGMDGFEAVKAIRSDADIAGIPIVMYTSHSGDIYVGQARALGAVDLLAKPATEEKVVAVLERVAELSGNTVSRPALSDTGAGRRKQPAKASDTMELDAYAVAMAAELQEREHLARAAESARLGSGAVTGSGAPDWNPRAGGSALVRGWVLPMIFMVLAAWLLFLYWSAERAAAHGEEQKQALTVALEWALNRDNGYDFGEPPFGDRVIDTLEVLIPHLRRAGFTGVVSLEGHIGTFCLSKIRMEDGADVEMLPEAELPLSACNVIGFDSARAASQSVLQSPEFDRYLDAGNLTAADAPIRVEVVAMGARQPRYAYPSDLENTTVGDWNAIALANNRVRYVLKPTASSSIAGNR